MVTRFDKSSKTRKGREYMLLWRLERELGPPGRSIIDLALKGNVSALELIERLAYAPRKRPALAAWVKQQMAKKRRVTKKKRDQAVNAW